MPEVLRYKIVSKSAGTIRIYLTLKLHEIWQSKQGASKKNTAKRDIISKWRYRTLDDMLLCLGNPLLDISVSAGEKLLSKYDLEPNNVILAEDKHKPLYEELVKNYDVDYIAGGAAQNTARIVQKILKRPNVVAMMGCVGRDSYSEVLGEKAKEVGVDVRYQYTNEQPTGTCAVIISDNGKHRSLCANLAAANLFTIDHIEQPDNSKIIDNVDYFYVTGFFVTVSPRTALEIAKLALNKKKVFILNLSAPYICQSYKEHLNPLLPHVDILFGNETEAEAFSEVYNLGTNDIEQIALKIADLPKHNVERKRLVVITQGEKPIVVATDGTAKTFSATTIPADKIVDTNGAGDAFVGGFLSQLIQKQPYDVCVKCGTWTAAKVVQQSGCNFDSSEEFCR